MFPGFEKRRAITFRALFLVATALFLFDATARADSFNAQITIISSDPARVRVEGEIETATKAWSFPHERLAAAGRGESLSNLSLADAGGVEVRLRKLAPGEFEAERGASRFSYELKLDPPSGAAEAAHQSWVSGGHGILMLGDALPVLPSKGRVTLKLPAGWAAYSTEEKDARGSFEVLDASQSLFVIGRDLRARGGRAASMDVSYVTAGEWAFADDDLEETSKESLDDYVKLTGSAPRRRALVVLLPFPFQAAGNIWNAETRGATVLLLSGRLPSKTAALVQLNGALTHELFHLWVPNGLALEGEYGWFYEGFTLYQALRAGMRLGRLTFQDYLNALGRAFDGYKAVRGQKELSLLEASERRWTSNPALVYHKGMLVAFLYDLTLMQRSGGKGSINDVYRELFRRHGDGRQKAEASRALISVLSGMPHMKDFAEAFVQNDTPIDLTKEIEIFGLRIETGGVRTHVAVAPSINTRQRDLLRRLGYNEKRAAGARRLIRDSKNHSSHPRPARAAKTNG